jgi:ribonuclease G
METHAVDAERRLRRHIAGSKSEAFLVELNSQVAGALIGPGASRLQELEKETGRHFAFKTKPRAAHDHFAVLAEGAAADIDPQSFPVSPGQELEVKIEEPHLHGETDAIARLDGYVVTVADAAEKVGETVRIRIEDATRTSARAVLGDADGEKPKKKTRRGSRGGRGRKKKVEAPVAETDGQPDAEPVEPQAQPAEPEAVAEPEKNEASPAEAPKKKKTRRGTRGGRGRKRKPVESAPEAGPDGPLS